jgi:hypothetical protein
MAKDKISIICLIIIFVFLTMIWYFLFLPYTYRMLGSPDDVTLAYWRVDYGGFYGAIMISISGVFFTYFMIINKTNKRAASLGGESFLAGCIIAIVGEFITMSFQGWIYREYTAYLPISMLIFFICIIPAGSLIFLRRNK